MCCCHTAQGSVQLLVKLCVRRCKDVQERELLSAVALPFIVVDDSRRSCEMERDMKSASIKVRYTQISYHEHIMILQAFLAV